MTIPASATVSQKSTYNYFKIQGSSAREIYTSLLKHAKGPAGHDAYATTAIQVFQKSKLLTAPNCRFQKLQIYATFKITLPKLQSASRPAATQKTWQGFSTALQTHEEHHRSLWMACAAKLEQAAAGLSAKNCKALTAKFKTVWKAIETDCTRENNNFDRAEQKSLLLQPFIKMVIGGR